VLDIPEALSRLLIFFGPVFVFAISALDSVLVHVCQVSPTGVLLFFSVLEGNPSLGLSQIFCWIIFQEGTGE
jgi:hypothetical protein